MYVKDLLCTLKQTVHIVFLLKETIDIYPPPKSYALYINSQMSAHMSWFYAIQLFWIFKSLILVQ
jgi:hypothetical protein